MHRDSHGDSFLEQWVMRVASDDRGYALVTVALISALALGLVTLIFTRSSHDFNSVSDDRRREIALHEADAAIEHALYRLDQDVEWNTGVPGTPLPSPFPTRLDERKWALDEAANVPPERIVTAPDGEWVVIKPPPQETQVAYGVGYIPTKAAPRNIRVIKATYKFEPFTPDFAILTGGNLDISGNPNISGDQGSVHANGDLHLSGDPTVRGPCPPESPESPPRRGCGTATSSGEYEVTGNPDVENEAKSGGGKPLEPIPLVNPRENYEMSQYDLCPDGKVRAGPSSSPTPNTSETPCTGEILGDASLAAGSSHGWNMTTEPDGVAKWRNDAVPWNGVFYIYLGNAEIKSSPGFAGDWQVTVFAEGSAVGEEKNHCPHMGGDIVVEGVGNNNQVFEATDIAYPLLFVAGRDLKVGGMNPKARYKGILAAHEQAGLTGNATIEGAILVNDYCESAGSPVQRVDGFIQVGGTPNIIYDGGLTVPFGKTIRLTNWIEL